MFALLLLVTERTVYKTPPRYLSLSGNMSDVMHKIIGTLKGGGMNTVINVLEDPKLINKLGSGPAASQEARSGDDFSVSEKAQCTDPEIISHGPHLSAISTKSKL